MKFLFHIIIMIISIYLLNKALDALAKKEGIFDIMKSVSSRQSQPILDALILLLAFVPPIILIVLGEGTNIEAWLMLIGFIIVNMSIAPKFSKYLAAQEINKGTFKDPGNYQSILEKKKKKKNNVSTLGTIALFSALFSNKKKK